MYFIIIFLSPMYLAIRKKWGAFTMNVILYALAWITIWFFGLGAIFWALGVGHAMWHFRRQLQQEQAREIATAMAEQQAKQAAVNDGTDL